MEAARVVFGQGAFIILEKSDREAQAIVECSPLVARTLQNKYLDSVQVLQSAETEPALDTNMSRLRRALARRRYNMKDQR